MSLPPGRPKEGSLPLGGNARSAKGALMMRGVALVVTAGLTLLLAACGERPQTIVYKQGTYQGKPDQLPSAGAPWNGNKTDWETAIKTRNQAQNEYKRTN